MVAAFQLNLFNTSAIEGEIARIERIRSEKDVIKALIGKAHSTLTNLETLLTGIQNVTLRETLQSAIAQELSKLFPSEGAAVATVSCDDPEKSLAVRAAAKLVPYFLNRQAITNKILSRVMAEVAGSTDAEGAWIWKDVYDAIETALVMFIQQEGNSLISQEGALNCFEQLNWLCPTHTRRSEEAIALQQFSTPLPMAYIASVAAQINAADIVLEPSAGTGLLAVWADIQGAKLILNEIAPRRREILQAVFPKAIISGHNAEQINDYLDSKLRPTAIIMNPPFSASPKMAKRNEFATWKHITSALARLQPGGRLVTLTANWFSPLNPDWRDYFVRIQKTARVAFSAGIAGQAYAKHGTLIETRLTVIDKVPADNPGQFAECYQEVLRLPDLLGYVNLFVPPRAKLGDSETERATPEKSATLLQTAQEKQGNRGGENYAAPNSIDLPTLLQPAQKEQSAKPKVTSKIAIAKGTPTASAPKTTAPQGNFGEIVELQYTTRDWDGSERELSEGIYEPYEPQVLAIKGAAKHPTPLVQSVAMASVAPPKPTYRPLLPKRVIEEGLLSDIQIESIIYAGEAHETYLKSWYKVDDTLDNLTPATEGEEGAVRFRRGWYNGDGTGVGKGRQVSGVILDNWLRGRKKALWISKSDKLLEDARRDWSALGGRSEDIVPLSKFRQGDKVDLAQGILFTTYATLRTEAKQGKKSRVEQIVGWLGKNFDGVIVFDESHAMANATTEKQERGTKKASLQGIAGLRLQRTLPEARIVYVSATGATTVQNLAYMERLGLWNSQDSPFTSREQFLCEIEEAGIAGLEVIARDLKALGLYTSRSLSYEGVEYQVLEHELTEEQVEVYDTYAAAFKVIHQNLQAALEATNIVSPAGKVRNRNAKSAARSAFESHKQRFFNFLLTGMKCPTLLRAIERDLAEGRAAVIQLVSTNEALLERRLAEIPTAEWNDLQIDITPREYIMDYLLHAFPVQLFETYTDEEGNERSQPVFDEEGNAVLSQEALRQRQELIEQIAMLPPIPSALDQIIQHFGHENIAEVTGRSHRIVREVKDGRDRLVVQKRSDSANLAETHAFMNDEKQILIFSGAGATGRSYHADLNAKNQRQRVQYLLEAGWRADEAVQGLGRTHRSNQAQPPLFSPVTTNVKGEKRFIATITKRLDSLGALTKGQRQTGSQGIFRSEDNLESIYARAALRQLFHAIYAGHLPGCSLEEFEADTGLSLTTEEGHQREELPPMSQFLNRLLALPIHRQNRSLA
jgi:predicted RNA methylase